MTPHARERCAEMGISTKVAKRIWRERSLTRPDYQRKPGRVVAHSSRYRPDLCIVVDTWEDLETPPKVVTVMPWNTEHVTDREKWRREREQAS